MTNFKKNIVAWFSGGVTSAVACKLAIELYGKENIRVIFIDTKNEDQDTYRFLTDCEKWYNLKIETITHDNYNSIEEVWIKNKSLNTATGAICSTRLKRDVRLKFQKSNKIDGQVFGYDIDEGKRAKAMTMNNPDAQAIYPLMLYGLTKDGCIKILDNNRIKIPNMYLLGFKNNNCFSTGCVQGGIGYWQKMQTDFPEKFAKMAEMEHLLTALKGKPVTMLKDQSKDKGLVFLKHNINYPSIKNISMMKGKPVKPLFECNGFCGTNDLKKPNKTEKEINYQMDMF